jgi:hypothetical protein
MPHRPDRRMLLAGLGVAGAMTLSRTARAATCGDTGELGPSGPTMRELSKQISRGPLHPAESRISILSLPSSATAQFVIDAPGVYFLPSPVTGVPGLSFLEIRASQVEVHCDGWHIEHPGQVARAGIVTPTPQSNIVIYDASFQNWPSTCIDLSNSPNCLVEESQFRNCNGWGLSGTGQGILLLGPRGFIFDCDQYDCLGSAMVVGKDGAIEEALSVGGSGGCFACPDGGVIENCFAMQNQGLGVYLGPGSTLTLSRVADNLGVNAQARCVIYDCEISGSSGSGVSVLGPDCNLEELYVSGFPIGIDVQPGGGGTLIDGNHVVGATTGIAVDPAAARCLVVRNQVGGGTLGSTGYAIPASSSYGTVRDVSSGGDINASALGPVQAYDNLQY